MKRVNHLYEKLISDENLELAILAVNSTHTWLPRHKPNKTVAWVKEDIPTRVAELRDIINGLIDETASLAPPKKKRRYDRSAGKWRDINEPLLWPDQYVHHALVQVLQPVMMRGMDRYCCGSIEGRGIHYGVAAMKKWRSGPKEDTQYCAQMDIHHFYDSIKPKYVIARMKKLIKDWRVLRLIERVLEHGVLIGVYCSQWFANTLLQPLDQLLHECGCKVERNLRYMDNFTLYGPNKRKLHRALRIAKEWLAGIELEAKGDWQVFRTTFTPKVAARHDQLSSERQRRRRPRLPSALGYRFGRDYALLRKRNLMRLKRSLARYYKRQRQGRPISWKLAAGLLSRLGQLRHCNHVKIYERIYRPGTQRELKNVIRKYHRREQSKWNTSSTQAA